MSERPLVSVIMPAYNAEQYVDEAIESALAQTYRPIEVLVADDGSTDGTAEVVRGYGKPVVYLHRENAGPAAARNLALEHAKGKYVAFLDADDLWHPRKLEAQVPLLEADPALGLCGAELRSFCNGEPVEWSPGPPAGEVYEIPGRTVIMRNRFSTSALLARAEAVKRAGGFDEDIFGPEDWDLWRRVTAHWRAVHLRAVVAAYRERPGSISGDAARMLENNRKVIRKSFADNPDLPWHVRLRTLSYLHLDAALEYGKGRRWSALAELAKSVALWPLPMGWLSRKSLLRARLAACLLAGIGGREKRIG